MDFGFDIDGTLSAAPEAIGAIMRALRTAGHVVHVITGLGIGEVQQSNIDERKHQLKVLGVENDYDFLHIAVQPVVPDKANYCRDHNIVLMFENDMAYVNAIKQYSTCFYIYPKEG